MLLPSQETAAMLPPRPPGPSAVPPAARKSGVIPHSPVPFETVKQRVLAKLADRMDLNASKRMPPSLLRQNLRQYADQITESEARGFAKPERDRIVDEVLAELLGYGPLEELFADPAVREVMVTGPGAVIARREQGHWLPTSVKFRDETHVRAVLDKVATHADPVGPVMASVSVFDMRLPNGFRVLAVIPPEALGQPATGVFLREPPAPAQTAVPKDGSAPLPGLPATGSTSNGTLRTVSGTVPAHATTRTPGSGPVSTPPPRSNPSDSPATNDPLARHRTRILERLLAKFASLKVYDLHRLDAHELEKIIAAYVSEYAEAEKIYLSDTDQGRLTLEILTSLRR
jgi:hypothetical protein